MSMFFLLFDSTAYGYDDFCLGQIDSLFGFLENFLRFVADYSVRNFYVHRFDWSSAGARFDFVTAEGSVLESHEPRGIAR